MELQSQSSIFLFNLAELICRTALQQLIRIFIKMKFLQSFLKSLHLLQVFIIIKTMMEWYNTAVNYLWPEEKGKGEQEPEENFNMPSLTRLKRLGNLMKGSIYSEQHREQICNFYSQLIKEYPQSKSTLKYPSFLYEPLVYSPQVCFQVPLTFGLAQLKGTLQLYILFPQNISNEMPLFYIKNPDYSKSKPNKKYVEFGLKSLESKNYEAVMGGVRVLLPQISKQRWQWTSTLYYKQQNIVYMVRWIHKQLLLDEFPFVKRKQQKQDSVQHEVKIIKQFLNQHFYPSEKADKQIPLLTNNQQLHTLSETLNSQIKIVQEEIRQCQQIQKENQKWDISMFLPTPKDKRSEDMIEAVSSLQALRDTSNLLATEFEQSKISLSEYQRLAVTLFRSQFDQIYKIDYWFMPELRQ